MLLQTNSYIVPKERRAEHARLIRRFRQALARIGCDQFEVYEQVGANWSPGGANGRYVQIMRFRDRQHQQAVQSAERGDPGAQAIIAEFCELINFPYQHQHGYFATGFYTSVIPIGPRQAVEYQPQDGYDEQAEEGGPGGESVAPGEIDATEFASTSVPADSEAQAAETEPEPEFELDDAEAAPDVQASATVESVQDSVSDSHAAGADAGHGVNLDMLREGDIQLEPEPAADMVSGSQLQQPHFGSPESAFADSPIAIPQAEAVAAEARAENPQPVENVTAEAPELSPEATQLISDAFPEAGGGAELHEPMPEGSLDVASETSPELPESTEMWEASVLAELPAANPGTVDELHPMDATDLSEAGYAEPVVDEFDPVDSGLIFEDEPADATTSTAGVQEFNEHAFAFDEPQLQERTSADAPHRAGGREEISSLYSTHDDLMPAALEPYGSDHGSAPDAAQTEHVVDALLDDAHLIDNVAFPGAAEASPKIHAAHEPVSAPGVDASPEKAADLMEFDAMIRDMEDPSADHGRRAH